MTWIAATSHDVHCPSVKIAAALGKSMANELINLTGIPLRSIPADYPYVMPLK